MGCIMIFDFETSASTTCPQPRGIFDGQHRAMAATRLLALHDAAVQEEITRISTSPSESGQPVTEAGLDVAYDFPLIVEVYPVRSEMQVRA